MKIKRPAFHPRPYLVRLLSLLAIPLTLALPRGAAAQEVTNPPPSFSTPDDSYFGNWFNRVSKIQSEQPHWITPITTVTPRLEEEYRYDQSFENNAEGKLVTNYGSNKGLELIPFENTEVILGVPGYITKDTPSDENGFADETFLLKYRMLSANEENGNYIVTGFLGLSVPTGSQHNTADHYVITPTLAAGKGFGDFDVQMTAGISIPDNGAPREGPGTPVQVNTAFQYRIIKVLWPEVEVNYTYWPNGEHEGKNQVFLTPGFIIGRLPIWERLGLTIGLGYQVALTGDPTFNHNVILSARLPF